MCFFVYLEVFNRKTIYFLYGPDIEFEVGFLEVFLGESIGSVRIRTARVFR